jgi:DNA-binding transcriptional ArsR family regulator
MLNQEAVGRVFRALDDATRRQMLERLGRGPTSVSELAKPLGISLAAVVQHLQLLEDAGIVRTEKLGRVRSCHLEGDGWRVATQWIDARRAEWERRLDRLGELVEEAPPERKKKR